MRGNRSELAPVRKSPRTPSVKFSVISHFCRCQFCLSPSISRLYVMNTEWMVGGCRTDGDASKSSFKGCFSQLYAADSVKNYGNCNVNRIMVVIP